MRTRTRLKVFFVLAAFVFAVPNLFPARRAAAYPNEPKGFGKATLGLTVPQFRKLFPKAKEVHKPAPPLELSVFTLEDQSILDLHPCQVRFRFTEGILYQIAFHCKNGEQVMPALRHHFGEPSMNYGDAGIFWIGDKTAISLNPTAHVFAFVDRARSQELQRRALSAVGSAGAAKASSPPATPKGTSTPEAKP